MNQQFMIKMMQAKKLQAEALLEIMPPKMIEKMQELESECIQFAKEMYMAGIFDLEMPKDKADEKTTKDNDKKVNKVTIED